MPAVKRPRLSHAAERRRRRRAAALFRKGQTTTAVAAALNVARPTAARWRGQWRRGGVEALTGGERPGSKPKLSRRRLRRLHALLLAGPQAHGFPSSHWTLGRIAHVVRRKLGVSYTPSHLRQLLKLLGWRYLPTDAPPTIYARCKWVPPKEVDDPERS